MSVHEGLSRVMSHLNSIPKERSKGVNYEFRSIDAVFNVIHGLMADNEMWFKPVVLDDWDIQLIPGTPDSKGNPRQQTRALFRLEVFACHADGSEASIGIGLCQSHDYGDKAVYQAQQNGMKYVIIEAFAIPTAEQDMDARAPDDISADLEERGTNQLKADALEMMAGDKAEAEKLYRAVLAYFDLDPDKPVPLAVQTKVRIELEAAAVRVQTHDA